VLEIAKRASVSHCSKETPCKFQARRDGSNWLVLVSFTKRNDPGDTPSTYPGGSEIIVVDAAGEVVATHPGE